MRKIKEHVKKHQVLYACIATAGITVLIMRSVASRPTSCGSSAVATDCGIASVIGEGAVLNNVSFISANRQGSPSWVVRCLETDEVFTSQHKAAVAMDIPQSELSQHLNGARSSVRGHTFERICMAA